jgi:mannose-6-phosphate isomerase-like protein (cupin superfamily)
MSTLLKKKYCHQRRISANTRTVDSDDESNDTSVGTSVQENDIVLDVTAGPVSIPPSPVSVTITNEDCDQSSMAPSIVAEKTECIDGQLGLNTKSVRFHNKNQIFIDNDYSEQVHKHRTDIWYTVSYFAQMNIDEEIKTW